MLFLCMVFYTLLIPCAMDSASFRRRSALGLAKKKSYLVSLSLKPALAWLFERNACGSRPWLLFVPDNSSDSYCPRLRELLLFGQLLRKGMFSSSKEGNDNVLNSTAYSSIAHLLQSLLIYSGIIGAHM